MLYMYNINFKIMMCFNLFSYYFNLVLFKIDDDDDNNNNNL